MFCNCSLSNMVMRKQDQYKCVNLSSGLPEQTQLFEGRSDPINEYPTIKEPLPCASYPNEVRGLPIRKGKVNNKNHDISVYYFNFLAILAILSKIWPVIPHHSYHISVPVATSKPR